MTDYVPPNVWKWEEPTGGKFESINRPTAGSQRAIELPKVSILFNCIL